MGERLSTAVIQSRRHEIYMVICRGRCDGMNVPRADKCIQPAISIQETAKMARKD